MKVRYWLCAVGSIAIVSGSASAASVDCGLSGSTGSSQLNRVFSQRAVEVIERAAQPNADSDDKLKAMIAPTAAFSLGGGDVGRPLGEGVAGARQMAVAMEADSFRFLGWDYMDSPEDACRTYRVSVDFVNDRTKSVSIVEFTFVDGRLVKAAGWQRSFVSGSLKAVSPGN